MLLKGLAITLLTAMLALAVAPAWAQGPNPQGAVKDWLLKHMPHPESYEGLDWSPQVQHERGPFKSSIRHLYRIQDDLGNQRIVDRIFNFNQDGEVIGTEDIPLGSEPGWHPLRP